MSDNDEKDSEVKEHYSKWMTNADLTKKLKRRIEKVGYPLEVAARKILHSNDFYVDHDKYYAQLSESDKRQLWREIDIVASFEVLHKEINNCTIIIDAKIVADCKYSSTNDFFAFQLDESSFFNRVGQGGLFWEFPIYLPRTRMAIYETGKTFGNFLQFSSIIENIAEIDVSKLKVHPEGKTIYEACHQVINALAYLADKEMSGREDYLNKDEERETMEKIVKTYQSLNKELWQKKLESGMKPEQATRETFLEIGNEIGRTLFPDIGLFHITLWIPMVILGRNNGLLQVITTDDRVKDLEEIKYGVYRFTPSIIPDFFGKSVRATDAFPVVICNLQHLNECIHFLKEKMPVIGNLIFDSIKIDNDQLLEEYMSYYKKSKKQS